MEDQPKLHTMKLSVDISPAMLLMSTAQVASAYVSHNAVQKNDLPEIIASIHAALVATRAPAAPPQESEAKTPKEIKQSIHSHALISFIDGKSYKTLKRHLSTHGLDPQSYRERFGLPSNYPMVCQDYSDARSKLATSMGLGQKRRRPAGDRQAPGKQAA